MVASRLDKIIALFIILLIVPIISFSISSFELDQLEPNCVINGVMLKRNSTLWGCRTDYNIGWNNLTSYPAACPTGQFIQQLGDNITCATPVNFTSVTGGWIDDGTVVRLDTITDLVGIGTINPTSKLHVVGNISIGDAKIYTNDTCLFLESPNGGTVFPICNP